MKIKKIEFRNIGAYGNKKQKLEFKEEGSLNLIVGSNGNGKCVDEHTYMNIKFENKELEKRYLDYLERVRSH